MIIILIRWKTCKRSRVNAYFAFDHWEYYCVTTYDEDRNNQACVASGFGMQQYYLCFILW